MDAQAMESKLDELILGWEHEIVEFKQGGAGFSTHDIGRYFSALSNEANLRGAGIITGEQARA